MSAQPSVLDSVRDHGRSPVPWGSVAMLGMVATVEMFVARHDLDVSTIWAQDWRFAARAARIDSPSRAVLCLGDSLMKFGVYPKVVETELGKDRRAYNLAMHSGKVPGTFFQLRASLEANARPAAVVVDYDATHLLMEPRSHLRQWPELISLRDCLDLAWTARDAALGGELLAKELLPSLRARDEIKEYFYDLYKRKPHWNRYSLIVHLRNWSVNQGAQAVGPSDQATEEETRKKQVPVLSSWKPNPINDRYVHRFIELARSRGIAVFWLIPPCREALQKRRDDEGGEKDFDAYVREITRRYSNVVVLDARRSQFPDAAFHDLTHLHRVGAIALSASIGAAIRERLRTPTGESWTFLPSFRDTKTRVPIEDLEESRNVVRSEPGRRKR